LRDTLHQYLFESRRRSGLRKERKSDCERLGGGAGVNESSALELMVLTRRSLLTLVRWLAGGGVAVRESE